MSKVGCLLLVALAASARTTSAQPNMPYPPQQEGSGQSVTPSATPGTSTPVAIPTVAIPPATSVSVPTVTIPQPTATPVPTPTPLPAHHHHRKHHRRSQTAQQPSPTPTPPEQWIWAYLTSYCPATAGFISSSGEPVFYGMLANDFYPFGTRVYLPVLGITGVVEDRIGAFTSWNHFDVWSPVCYSTPTGWFEVAIETG